MSKPIVRAENLGKAYLAPKFREETGSPGDAIQKKTVYESFWALRHVSFEVGEGEIVGIVGSNGAGKTTLLKILSKVTAPTEGYAEVHGRLGSLLQVGAGFHEELSGRENVYLNGAILGMKRSDIDARFTEIVEFSEIGRFIDFPLKHYSSGMAARLAFSIAAHLEPEVLILDEILSVGDTSFQQKCQAKMRSVIKDGRTVLIVSHNLTSLPDLCTRAFHLSNGELVHQGELERTLSLYLSGLAGSTLSFDNASEFVTQEGGEPVGAGLPELGPLDMRIELEFKKGYPGSRTVFPVQTSLTDRDGVPRQTFFDDEPIVIHLHGRCTCDMELFRCIICFISINREPILASTNLSGEQSGHFIKAGPFTLKCTIPPDLLWARSYVADIVLDNRGVERVSIRQAVRFRIESRSKLAVGLPQAGVRHPLHWSFEEAPVAHSKGG